MNTINEVYVAELWFGNELYKMRVFSNKQKAIQWAMEVKYPEDDVVITKYEVE